MNSASPRVDVFRLPLDTNPVPVDRIYATELAGFLREMSEKEPKTEWSVRPIDLADEVL